MTVNTNVDSDRGTVSTCRCWFRYIVLKEDVCGFLEIKVVGVCDVTQLDLSSTEVSLIDIKVGNGREVGLG